MHTTKMPLIGKYVTITDATTDSLRGISGEVVDETKYRLIIKTKNNEIKKMDKTAITFTMNNSTDQIQGKDLAKTMIERIKTKVK